MRDYDPTSGRYIQADPLGLVDGASVYGYAKQNPARYTDPTGEFVPILLWFAAGMLIDYALDEGCYTCEDLVWSAALNALPWHKFGVLLKMARGTSKARKVAKATNKGIDGIWDRGRFTPTQRGNAIEDHLATTYYGGWTRVGAQNNGFSRAFDFNQGSTRVSLKMVDTGE